MLVTRRFIINTVHYSSRRVSIKNVSRIRTSIFQSFSCITLNRVRDPRGIKDRRVHCYKAPLGCSFSRTKRRGSTAIIRLLRGKGLGVERVPLGPLQSVQGLGNACVRVASLSNCRSAGARSCIRVALASRRSVMSKVRGLHAVCPGLVELRCSGQHAERGRRVTNARAIGEGSRLRCFRRFFRLRGGRPVGRRRQGCSRSLVHGVRRIGW